MSVVTLGDLTFNPDGATIAVGSTGQVEASEVVFQDAVGDIHFWNPFRADHSVAVARKAGGNAPPYRHSSLLFSGDGPNWL
jgi:hypothetical protein